MAYAYNKILFGTTWMNLESTVLNEGKPGTNVTFYNSIYMKREEMANLQRQKVDQQLSRPEGSERKWRVAIYGYEVSLRGDENVQKLIVVIVIQHREHTKKTIELKLLNCEFYVNKPVF